MSTQNRRNTGSEVTSGLVHPVSAPNGFKPELRRSLPKISGRKSGTQVLVTPAAANNAATSAAAPSWPVRTGPKISRV